jgi:hypothetical protein
LLIHLTVCRRHDSFGVPFRVKRGLGKQISFIAAGRPRHLKCLSPPGDPGTPSTHFKNNTCYRIAK